MIDRLDFQNVGSLNKNLKKVLLVMLLNYCLDVKHFINI